MNYVMKGLIFLATYWWVFGSLTAIGILAKLLLSGVNVQ